ncbi:unnamed protein product [Linum trigynum]|uniref:Uncharacterized protein n=1 Tax=Linum trigynum TaxID=586398 RepID=A0AAV2C8R4_9ROSI
MFSVPLPSREVGYLFGYHNPLCRYLGLSSTGQGILVQESGDRLIWCDVGNPESPAAQELMIIGLEGDSIDSVVCFESLVAPNGQLPRLLQLQTQ